MKHNITIQHRGMSMQKLCACLWGLVLMGGSVQAADPTTSCNIVGYVNLPVASTNQFTCVAVNFTPMTGAGTLSDLLGDQLKASNDSRKAGKVMLWHVGTQQFLSYGLKENGLFYPVAKWVGGLPHTARIEAGSVLWVQGVNGALTVSGVINESDAVTNSLAGGPDYPMNLICYPYPVTVPVQDFINTSHGALANDDLAKADKLMLWDSSKGVFINLGLKGDGKWHKTAGWTTNPPYLGVIRLGEGVYFQSGHQITWVVKRPFDRYTGNSSPSVEPAAALVCDEGKGMLFPPKINPLLHSSPSGVANK